MIHPLITDRYADDETVRVAFEFNGAAAAAMIKPRDLRSDIHPNLRLITWTWSALVLTELMRRGARQPELLLTPVDLDVEVV